MSTLISLLWIATVAQPVAAAPDGRGGFDRRMMLSRPLPDPKLERGTVAVLVRKGRVALESAQVQLLPATAPSGQGAPQALAQGATNAEGRASLPAAAFAGRQVKVVVRSGQVVRASAPFQIPELGGVRFLFNVGPAPGPGDGGKRPARPAAGDRSDGRSHGHGHAHGHGHGGPAAPSGPTTRDPKALRLWVAFRVMAIESGEVHLSLTYSVINRGRETFDPGEHGLLLPVPEGAKGVSLPRGTRGANVDKNGIRVTRPVPPGRHGLRLRAGCRYPYDSPRVVVRLHSVVPLLGYAVSLKDYQCGHFGEAARFCRLLGLSKATGDYPRGLRVRGEHLRRPERRAHDGGVMMVYRANRDRFPQRQVAFSFEGLPVRSRARSWPFAGLALLLVLGSIAFAVGRRRRPSGAADAENAADADPLDARVRIERDRRLGLISDDEAAALVKKLEKP